MGKRSNIGSFYLILICMAAAAYSLYSNLHHMWSVIPPNYILLMLSLAAFIFGVTGLKDKRNWWTRIRSGLTIILSTLMSIGLFLVLALTLLASSMGANEHIKTVSSPDNRYTIDFYRYDAGAAGSFGVRGELNGLLWLKKRIYYQDSIEQVEVRWESNDRVSINNLILELDEGETHGYE